MFQLRHVLSWRSVERRALPTQKCSFIFWVKTVTDLADLFLNVRHTSTAAVAGTNRQWSVVVSLWSVVVISYMSSDGLTSAANIPQTDGLVSWSTGSSQHVSPNSQYIRLFVHWRRLLWGIGAHALPRLPTRSTQPSIPPGWVSRVPVCLAGDKAGCVHLFVAQRPSTYSQGNWQKFWGDYRDGVGKSGVLKHKSGNISETRKDRGKVTMESL